MLEEEERLRLEALRRSRELEEEEELRRRLAEEEARRRRELEEEEARRRANMTHEPRAPRKVAPRKEKFEDKKEEFVDVNRNPLEYNEGDDDLEPYLKPLLANAGKPL